MPEPIGAVGALETHISQLFFTPDRVYKRLKPVDVGFVSFVDPDERLAAAEREYRLNRRVSPDVYLGLADIIEHDELADRLIVMRRLPADRQLSQLINHPDFERHIVDTARLIASFHSRQEPVTGADAWMATGASLHANWAENFSAIAPLAGSVLPAAEVETAQSLVYDYLRGRKTLFAERVDHGRIRDGHGDLRAEHVFCLDDGPRLIDCLAFRDDYRIGDVLNDVAFLAMDLHRLAGPRAAATLVRAYGEFTDEHHPATLAHHYVAYRAHIRAKVAAIRFRQGIEEAAAEAVAYHRLAVQHLQLGQVRLVLVGGGAGAGKSTVAKGLADRLGAIWLRSDEVRKNMAGVAADRPGPNGPGEGLYDQANSDRVYAELLNEASKLLARGESVVLDATWHAETRRQLARDVATRSGASLSELHCVVPLPVAQERIARRMASIDEPSDATPEIASFIADRFEQWPTAARVETTGSIPDSVDEACRLVLDPEPATTEPAAQRRAITVDTEVVLNHESIRFYLSSHSALRALAGSEHVIERGTIDR